MSDQDTPAQDTTPAECHPCSGKGKVISNLGGTPSEIVCPWCEGTGKFILEHDAQERWAKDSPAPQTPDSEAESADSGSDLPA